ncbi:predicted protein [Micromonas commoda]|uniref:Fringe-like glycosyltransferase domain-containing protein n=1 Tax=Micromonas commoda (strain RCC299 / NOUM17 / CCMP2709) TaxID=296587 RepID=C1EJP6_MICCC|nr:predicted protein [Micromonas commoda]ACO68225.1 predicted protein [Micromonas commoda]|eukprot:XP_002506967.1 predicted protein [Micromonas commoda]
MKPGSKITGMFMLVMCTFTIILTSFDIRSSPQSVPLQETSPNPFVTLSDSSFPGAEVKTSNPLGPGRLMQVQNAELGSAVERTAFVVVTQGTGTPLFQAQLRTWFSLVPNRLVYETNGELRGSSFIEAMAVLSAKFNTAHFEWFVLIDDDGYIDLEQLDSLLEKSQSPDPVYMGIHHCQGPNFRCRKGSVKDSLGGWVNGGAGTIMNRRLVDMVDWSLSVKHYARNWPYKPVAADVALACALQDYAGNSNDQEGSKLSIKHVEQMYYGPKVMKECECMIDENRLCTNGTILRPISLHHVTSAGMDALFSANTKNRTRYLCMAGSDSHAFDRGDCISGSQFKDWFDSDCLEWNHLSGPWTTTVDTSQCKKFIHTRSTCVERDGAIGRVQHCGHSMRWKHLGSLPTWVLDDPRKKEKFLAYSQYRKNYKSSQAKNVLRVDNGTGISLWESSWNGDLFLSPSSLNQRRHNSCAVVLRGPNLCKHNLSGIIDSTEFFDAVFRKGNDFSHIHPEEGISKCSGTRSTYAVTHTLDTKQVGDTLRSSENIVMIPNDDPKLFNDKNLRHEGRKVNLISHHFAMFLRNATCPCQLPPKSPVVPGISSGFYIVMVAKLMCEKVTVFCWENYGWGTPAFFETNAKIYDDGIQRNNHFANLNADPKSEHCLLEESLWLREMRDEGHIQYVCGSDKTFVPAWRMNFGLQQEEGK